jgi:hypothetical protein
MNELGSGISVSQGNWQGNWFLYRPHQALNLPETARPISSGNMVLTLVLLINDRCEHSRCGANSRDFH